ncbi:hypothetical protein HEK616_65300 [Streptomyces nigrescens]|uniref:Uncharacterized protein n=1 Tax=Streptomyces nigrescens TaxID=1920 RepID=A0ABM8A322_STRNI|nr:hypothetical protein HEK616_65300 [Streptomyces nigrescens]
MNSPSIVTLCEETLPSGPTADSGCSGQRERKVLAALRAYAAMATGADKGSAKPRRPTWVPAREPTETIRPHSPLTRAAAQIAPRPPALAPSPPKGTDDLLQLRPAARCHPR